jgi:hypothetical protein
MHPGKACEILKEERAIKHISGSPAGHGVTSGPTGLSEEVHVMQASFMTSTTSSLHQHSKPTYAQCIIISGSSARRVTPLDVPHWMMISRLAQQDGASACNCTFLPACCQQPCKAAHHKIPYVQMGSLQHRLQLDATIAVAHCMHDD